MRDKILKTYPYPIAYRYGCIVRDQHDDVRRLDQTLRCAEAASRYLAVLALASSAAREEDMEAPTAFRGFDFSWGRCTQAVREVVAKSGKHPLRETLAECLCKDGSKVFDNLEELRQIRNCYAHAPAGSRMAQELLERHRPLALLEDTLTAIEPVCMHPLFRAENLPPRRKVFSARIYMLMGEQGDPIPQDYEITEPFEDDQIYLGLPEGALSLSPWLVWRSEESQPSPDLYCILRVDKQQGDYSRVRDSSPRSTLLPFLEVKRLLDGKRIALENVYLKDGKSFLQEWDKQCEKYLPVQPILPESLSLSNH